MSGRVVGALSTAIVIAVPVLLIGNATWLLVNPWFVDAQYLLPGFPVDPRGVQDPERTELAKAGVRAIRPGGEGIAVLQQARLPDGRVAFEVREIRHMSDVRGVMTGLFILWAVAAGVIIAAGQTLRRLGRSADLRRALIAGSTTTVWIVALLGVMSIVGFDQVFAGLHDLLFAPGTWRFNDRFTLRQLYPDAFWAIAGATLLALALLQAAMLAAWARRGPRPVR